MNDCLCYKGYRGKSGIKGEKDPITLEAECKVIQFYSDEE